MSKFVGYPDVHDRAMRLAGMSGVPLEKFEMRSTIKPSDQSGGVGIPIAEILLPNRRETFELLLSGLDEIYGKRFTESLRSSLKGNYQANSEEWGIERPMIRSSRVRFVPEKAMTEGTPGLGLAPIFFALYHEDYVRSLGPEAPYWWAPDLVFYSPCQGLVDYPVITRDFMGPIIQMDYIPNKRDRHGILNRLVAI